MKLYLHTNGVFYEKQADCPSKNFEAVEFPFAATPKADFVAWINQNSALAKAATGDYGPGHSKAEVDRINDLLAPPEELPVDRHVRQAIQPPAPREFFGAQHPLTTMAIEDWCEAAQPHQLGTVVRAAALRLQQIAQQQE